MVFCSKCGHELDSDEKFCPNCGASCGDSIDKVKDKLNYNKSTTINSSNDNKSREFHSDSSSKYPEFDSKSDNHHTQSNKNLNSKGGGLNALFCIVGVIVAVLLVFGLMSMFSGGDSIVTINGIDFNIPEGYSKDPSNTRDFIRGIESASNDDYYEAQVYSKGKESIGILVVDGSNVNLNRIDGKTVSYAGHKGKLGLNHATPSFTYLDNGKYIVVVSTDARFSDIII